MSTDTSSTSTPSPSDVAAVARRVNRRVHSSETAAKKPAYTSTTPSDEDRHPVPQPLPLSYYESVVDTFSNEHVRMLANSFRGCDSVTDEERRLYRSKDIKLVRKALASHMHRQTEIGKDVARAVVSKRIAAELRRRARVTPVHASSRPRPTKKVDNNGWGKDFSGSVTTANVGDTNGIGPANHQFGDDPRGSAVAGSNAKRAKNKASKK